MAFQATAGLDSLLSRYEQRAAIVRKIRDLISSDPDLAKDVVSALHNGDSTTKNSGVDENPHLKSPVTHFERIYSYFVRIGNQWQTLSEIAEGVGLKRDRVSAIIYKSKSHKRKFVQKEHSTDRKQKIWRLAEPIEENTKRETDRSESGIRQPVG